MKRMYSIRKKVRDDCLESWKKGRSEVKLEQLVGTIYDGLTDDEEEVRNLTAEVVDEIFTGLVRAKQGMPITSVEAQTILFQYYKAHVGEMNTEKLKILLLSRLLGLPTNEHHSNSAMAQTMQRISLASWLSRDDAIMDGGIDSHPAADDDDAAMLYSGMFKQAGPAAQRVQEAADEDKRLFEEERQNLYRDEVGGMKIWCDILISMPPPESNMAEIYEWAIYGLDAISNSRGSPGWANLRNGFESVCRVLIFSKVVQAWSKDAGYLKRLWTGVSKVASALGGTLHPEHSRLMDDLKPKFEEINLVSVDL